MKDYKILVIDDEPNNIEAIIDCLTENKYQIFIAVNGEAGYEIACVTKPSLIIMDWDMPGLNGIESIKKIKSKPALKNIPIIMATGKMLTSENLQEALEAGAIDYIRKPIDKIELNARIKSMIVLHQAMEKNIELERKMVRQKELKALEKNELQKKELAKKTLSLIGNTELSIWLLKKIEILNISCNDEGKKIVAEIVKKYKVNNLDSNWNEFELLFEKVHGNFQKALLEKFPNLTNLERRLCAFYKLNMTTKDICAITFQSENTLKKARYRLRQKLKLNTNENLANYLASF